MNLSNFCYRQRHPEAMVHSQNTHSWLNASYITNVSHITKVSPTASVTYSTALEITALTLGIAIIIFGFFGNILTIAAIIKTPSLRHGPNLFILNLSLADLLFCTLTIPVRLVVIARDGWYFNSPPHSHQCKLHATISYTLIGTSMLCQVGTAFGRFLRFIWPDAYQRFYKRKKRLVTITVACWVIPVLAILPTTSGAWGKVDYDQGEHSCKIICQNHYAGFCRFYLSIILFLPALIIIFCYLRILRVVCANRKRVTIMRFQLRQRQFLHQRPTNTQDHREDVKFTAMMLCVFFVFLVCYFLYAIFHLVKQGDNQLVANTATTICAWFSACLNPLVYVVMNSNFRHAIVNMMTCKVDQPLVTMWIWILNFIPLWEWMWCHCVFYVRQAWKTHAVVSLLKNMCATTTKAQLQCWLACRDTLWCPFQSQCRITFI